MQSSPSTDEAALACRVIARAPERDLEAESELCRRLAPRIRLFGLKHLRSDAAASDLVQDVLILTLQKLRGGGMREPERLASFVLATARQMIVDWRRNSARRGRLLDAFSIDLTPFESETAASLDADRLRLCLEQVSERERAVLVMTFYDDRAAGGVGAELGLSAEEVRVIRLRGVERLQGCMSAAIEPDA